MANAVKLTFAGEEKPLTDSMGRVGEASKRMGDDVGEASRKVGDSTGEAANGLERVGGSADNAERNIIGVHDVIDGTATIMQGPGKQGIVAYLQGWADLAGGIAPMAEYLAQTRAATLAQAAAGKVAAAGSKVWAAGQWLVNSAFFASPITWIIVGIVALVAVIVLIARKTDWFSQAWRASWSWIQRAASSTWNFLKKIPGWIATAFRNVGNFILAPYKAAFNGIARAWNNTVGRLSWSVPGWVPFIGGNTISVPHLPTFHSGGIVPGVVGTAVPILAQAGERVSSRAAGGGGGDGDWLKIDLGEFGAALLPAISRAVQQRGGGRASSLGIKVVNGAVRA
jgi:phage-related protein